MYAKKHRPMQKLTAICLSVTIAAASLLSGHVFASDEAPQTDYPVGQELLDELREMGLGQDVILDGETPESGASSETDTEEPSDTTGEPGDGGQTGGTEPGNPDGSDPSTDPAPDESAPSTDPDPGESSSEPSAPAESDPTQPGEGDSGMDSGADNPEQPSAPAESTGPAEDPATEIPVVEEVPLVIQEDEDTADVIDPDKPEPPESSEPAEESSESSAESSAPTDDSSAPVEESSTPTEESSEPSEESSAPSEEPSEEPSEPSEKPSEPSEDPSSEPEAPSSEPESPAEELPAGITAEQRAALEAYVQTLEAEQVVSLDETDITVEEYDDLYSMLTADQLAAIEALLAGPNGEEIYGLIMAAQTLDEVNAILDSLDRAGLNALFGYMSEEQYAAMMDWIAELEQAAIEAALSGVTTNFTNAAPLVDSGASSSAPASSVMRRSAARAALYAPFADALTDTEDNGLEIDKWVEMDENGKYTLKLEAYATGEVDVSTEYKAVPTDIVLVLDQSGSMDYGIISGYQLIQERHADKLYDDYRDNIYTEVDGVYYEVTITPKYGESYEVKQKFQFGWEGAHYKAYTNYDYYEDFDSWWPPENIYCQIDDQYIRVTNVSRTRNGRDYTYTYHLENGSRVTSQGQNTVPENIYQRISTVIGYSFSYSPAEGGYETIVTVDIDDSVPEGYEFYYATTSSRLSVLKDTLNSFIASVQDNAEENGVDHRIAMVGFADGSNSEVLTGTWEEGRNSGTGARYSWKDSKNNEDKYNSVVESALMDVTEWDDYQALGDAIDNLDADGATGTDEGLTMANDIFEAYTDAGAYSDGERQKVVIVFTDGVPTTSSSFSGSVANDAIKQAQYLKSKTPITEESGYWQETHNGYGATVYTIGIFDGADASNPSNLPDYNDRSSETDKANRFMHLVSSNYPNATEMSRPGQMADLDGDSYYLSAGDADALSDIFQQIADKIETGGSDVGLGASAVLRDIITPYFQIPTGAKATAQVYNYNGNGEWADHPNNAYHVMVDTTGNTVEVTGYDYSEEYIWDNDETQSKYGGSKLVVTIPIERDPDFIGGNAVPTNETTSGIYAKDEDATAFETFPVPSVNVPIDYSFTVSDKTIYLSDSQAIDFGSGEVFYDGSRATALLDGTAHANDYVNIVYTVKNAQGKLLGTYTIVYSSGGVGSWKDSNTVPSLTPEDCTELTITCTVTPIYTDNSSLPDGIEPPPEDSEYVTAKPVNAAKTDGDKDGKADIHVLKPTLNFHDTMNQEDGNNLNLNKNSSATGTDDFVASWTDFGYNHTKIPAASGDAPEITLVFYQYGDNGWTLSSDEVPSLSETTDFKVGIKLDDGDTIYTKTEAKDAVSSGSISWNDYNAEFRVIRHCDLGEDYRDDHDATDRHFTIHVPKEFTLTIAKNSFIAGYVDGETFRFSVYKVEGSTKTLISQFTLGDRQDNNHSAWSQKLILEPGTYEIVEDQGWSWRYDCASITSTVDGGTAALGTGTYTATFNDDATVTFTNKKADNHWLSWEDTKVNVFNPAS